MKRKSKLMAAAVALLGFSTAATVTGTVAWFTAANTVSVSGMNIQAEAEQGIVIAKELASYSDESWGISTNAAHSGEGLAFIPTTTLDVSTWKHGNAENVNNWQAGTGDNAIQTITVTEPTLVSGNGAGVAEVNSIADRNIYLLNHFYVQSVTTTAISNQKLVISNLTATDSANEDLNKSLRIVFVYGSTKLFYCPLLGADFAGTTHSATAKYVNGDIAGDTEVLYTGDIPGYIANSVSSALDIKVYAYFDGEDTNCKSANIDTLNSISLSFKLKNIENE